MRPIPIPDGVAESMGGRRIVIGEPDPTRDDVRPRCRRPHLAHARRRGAPMELADRMTAMACPECPHCRAKASPSAAATPLPPSTVLANATRRPWQQPHYG